MRHDSIEVSDEHSTLCIGVYHEAPRLSCLCRCCVSSLVCISEWVRLGLGLGLARVSRCCVSSLVCISKWVLMTRCSGVCDVITCSGVCDASYTRCYCLCVRYEVWEQPGMRCRMR